MAWAIGALLLGVSWGATYALWRDAARSRRKQERLEKAHLDERRELLNRIMYLSNKPWEPPPEMAQDAYEDFEPVDDPMLMPLPGERYDDEVVT